MMMENIVSLLYDGDISCVVVDGDDNDESCFITLFIPFYKYLAFPPRRCPDGTDANISSASFNATIQ